MGLTEKERELVNEIGKAVYSSYRAVHQEILDFEYSGEIVPAIFISSNDISRDQEDTFIPNADLGFFDKVSGLGQAGTQPAKKDLLVSPYSMRMRPVTDLSFIFNANGGVELKTISTFAYDSLEWDGVEAGEGQDDATVEAIVNSLSDYKAYSQSRLKNGQIYDFQPNWFRPDIRVNGIPVLRSLTETNFGSGTNKGDLSIGLPVGSSFNDVKKFYGKVKSIDVYSQLTQRIVETSLYQRYITIIVLDFRVRT